MNSSKQKNKKPAIIICLILSVVGFWLGLRFGMLCGNEHWIDKIGYAADNIVRDIQTRPLALWFTESGMAFALILGGAVWLFYIYNFVMPKPEKVGIEHGSSRWATKKEILGFKNLSEEDKNIVFSENSGLAVEPDKQWSSKHKIDVARNLNIAVIGGSGSGKTRFYVKPNLMKLQGNYFVTDPKGTVIEECGHLMKDNDYEIKCFNVIPDTMNQSMCYNPLHYITTYEQILAFVNCLMKNTEDQKKQGGDDFWPKAERLLYIAILSFMMDWCPREEFTLPKLVEYIGMAQAMEEDETFESPLDIIFKEIETGYMYVRPGKDSHADEFLKKKEGIDTSRKNDEQVNIFNQPRQHKVVRREYNGAGVLEEKPGFIDVPSVLVNNKTGYCAWDEFVNSDGKKMPDADNHFGKSDFCVTIYQEFKKAAGKTLKSIIISCNARLMPIQIPELERILSGKKKKEIDYNEGVPYIKEVATGECEMELDKLGDPGKKMSIFAIMSDTNDTYFFLVAIMMYQVIDLLCNKALTDFNGKLPSFVHFIFDEFANLGVLPDFQRTIAITRSRNIGISMILQTPFQLESNYKKEDAKTIMDNCDTLLYLGGGSVGADNSTCKEISERLGKETIHTRTYNRTRSQQGSTSENNAIQGRDLMMPDEVFRLPRSKCLLMIKNAYPYQDNKFPLESNPRYAYIDPEAHNSKYEHLLKHKKNFDFVAYKKELYGDIEGELEEKIKHQKEEQERLRRQRDEANKFSPEKIDTYYDNLVNEVLNRIKDENLAEEFMADEAIKYGVAVDSGDIDEVRKFEQTARQRRKKRIDQAA